MTTVYMRDVREVTFCSKGTRQFFINHNLDFSDFLKNGIDAEKLTALNDAMANKVVLKAMERESNGRV